MLRTFDKQFLYGNQSMSNQDTIELYCRTFYDRDLENKARWGLKIHEKKRTEENK